MNKRHFDPEPADLLFIQIKKVCVGKTGVLGPGFRASKKSRLALSFAQGITITQPGSFLK